MTRHQTFVIYQALLNAIARMREKNEEVGMTTGAINYPSIDFTAEINFSRENFWNVELKVTVDTEEGKSTIKQVVGELVELPNKNIREVAAKLMIEWGFDFDMTREISHRGILRISELFGHLYNRVVLQEEVEAKVASQLQMKTGSIEIYVGMKYSHPTVIHGVTLTLESPDIPNSEVSLGLGGMRINTIGYRDDIIAELIERFEGKIAK